MTRPQQKQITLGGLVAGRFPRVTLAQSILALSCLLLLSEGTDQALAGGNWLDITPGAASNGYLYFMFALAIAALAGLTLGAWNFTLRRKVSQRTAELRATLQFLRASEDKLRVVLDGSSDPIVCLEHDGTHSFANKAAAAVFGKEPEDIIGLNISDLFPPEEAKKKFQLIEYVFAHGQTRSIDIRVPRPSGDLYYITSATPIKDRQGKPTSAICIAKDITDRKRAEEALRRSEEQLCVIFDTVPSGIIVVSSQGDILFANQRMAQLFGCSLDELIGGSYPEYTHASQSDEARDNMLRLMGGDIDLVDLERLYQRLDGGTFWGHISGKRLLHGDGSFWALLGVITDITERKRNEEALLESERRYREIFDSIDDFIYTHDLRGNILTFNQAALRALGIDRDELAERSVLELLVSQRRRKFLDNYLPKLIANGQISGCTELVASDGQVRHIHYHSKLVQEEGRVPYVSGVCHDITERILSERELGSLNEQLLQAQKMELVGALAGGIAHNFNNVLQTVSGYTELVQAEQYLSPAGRERLTRIERTTERAARLVKQLMTLAPKLDSRRESIDLNREVLQSADILRHTLSRRINIGVSLAPDLKPMIGDAAQVEQVLLNLATNASHAMPQGGELLFRTRNQTLSAEDCKALPGLQPGEHVVLEAIDTGEGMDEETLSHLFEPFFTTKPAGEGTGLGLSTAYSIVANHGGHILCQSRPKGGTTFTILFPVAPIKDLQSLAPKRVPPENTLAGNETLLLVDDEKSILDSGQEALAAFGYRVLTASRGEEALDIFLKDPSAVDFVILDLNMPGMEGLECLKIMLAAHPQAGIVVATGYAGPGLKDTVTALGGRGIIQKPYRFAELLAVVRGALDRHQKK